MKRKNLVYYLMIILLVLGACARKDKEDAERLNQLNSQVESLYNEKTDDLAEGLSEKKLNKVKEKVQSERMEELSEENKEFFETTRVLYQDAQKMYDLEEKIKKVFKEDLVKEKVTEEAIEGLSTELSKIDQEKRKKYIQRQEEKLDQAKKQLEKIEEAEALVADLYQEDGQVSKEANREKEILAQEAVAKLENNKIQTNLEKRLEKVNKSLTEREDAQRRSKSMGDFKGYYHDESENFLITISEDQYEGFVPHSDVFFQYEIREIIHNSGDNISLVIHHDEYDGGGYSISESTKEVHWELINGGDELDLGSTVIRRITEEEFEALENPFNF